MFRSRALLALLFGVCAGSAACGDDPVTVPPDAPQLSAIEVTPASPSVAVGQTVVLSALGRLDDGSTQALPEVAWSSADTSVARVLVSGVVTGVAVGTAEIRATAQGVEGKTTVTVTASPLASLALSPSTISLPRGDSVTLEATATFEDGTTQVRTTGLIWSSSSDAVATVVDGVVTAVAPGDATISAEDMATGIRSGDASSEISVPAPPAPMLRITPTGVRLPEGRTVQLVATLVASDGTMSVVTDAVIWSSSASGTVEVSNEVGSAGVATARAEGSATIEAVHPLTSVRGSVTLSVTPPVLESLSVTPVTATVAMGRVAPFAALGVYSNGTQRDLTRIVTWRSTAPTVATIGAEGRAQPVAPGVTTIACVEPASGIDTDARGTSGRLAITPPVVDLVAVTPMTRTLALGQTVQLTAVAVLSDNSNRDITNTAQWVSTNPNVISVNASGLGTPASAGTAVVSATDPVSGVSSTTSNLSATITVTPPALVSIAISPATAVIVLGATRPLIATGTFSDGSSGALPANSIQWSSSANAVTISATGIATGAALGGAELSVVHTASGIEGGNVVPAVVVSAALASLSVTPTSTTVPTGASATLIAEGTLTDASTADLSRVVQWSSSDPAVAAVAQGVTTAGVPGVARISVTEPGSGIASGAGGSATFMVPAGVSLTSVAVLPSAPSVLLGRTQQMMARATYSDASRHEVTEGVAWASSSAGVATVSNVEGSRGLVRSVAPGVTTISALHVVSGIGSGNESAIVTVVPQTQANFDTPGSVYVTTQYAGTLMPTVTPGGPFGAFLRFTQANVPSTHSTIGFERVATGPAPSRVVIDFDFRLTPAAGCSADGIGVALLATSSYGATGPAPQFAEEVNLPGTLGVGFDIYDNAETFGANHASLHFNGAAIANYAPGVTLASSTFFHARIVVRSVGATMHVDLQLGPSGGTLQPVFTDVVVNAPLYEARPAFGARCGACSASQDLDNVLIQFE